MTIHVTGSGIASLAAAVFLIHDAGVAPDDIRIYEECDDPGGAMVMHGDPVKGYVLPATRVLERKYGCALDLFSHFPSVADPQETIEEADVLEFNREFPYRDKARLLDDHQRVYAARHFGVSFIDQLNALKLLATPEFALDGKVIDRYFTPAFYQSEFFLAWSTLMGPLRQHGAIEFRRYLLRFLHILPVIDTMTDVWRMRWNQDDGVVAPIRTWLVAQGVHVLTDTAVENVSFRKIGRSVWMDSITLSTSDDPIVIGEGDRVFVTLGSQAANLRIGSMRRAPDPARDARARLAPVELGSAIRPPLSSGATTSAIRPRSSSRTIRLCGNRQGMQTDNSTIRSASPSNPSS